MRSLPAFLKTLVTSLIVFLSSILVVDPFCFSVKDKSFCFFHVREPSYSTSWEEAWEICRENGSSLPSIENPEFQKTFVTHLKTLNLVSDIWLAGREQSASQWQWPNGKVLSNQEIAKNGLHLYNTRAVIKREVKSHPRCKFEICFLDQYAAYNRKYVCQYPDTSELCQNSSAIGGPISLDGRCFLIYNEEINLYEAINKCFEYSGDLANLEDLDGGAQNYARFRDRLVSDQEYWIGLRKKWWIWNKTDTTFEIKYNDWSSPRNNLNEECVSIGSSSIYKWKQRRCNDRLQFLCQITSSSSAEEEIPSSSSPSSDDPIPWTYIAAAIGVIAVVVIVTGLLLVFKMRNRSNVTKEERYDKRKPADQSDQHQRQYEHINKKKGISMIEGSDGNAVYAEITDNDTSTTENQQTNNSDLYAQICSAPDNRNDQGAENINATDQMTSQGVVYATMEFEKEK